MANRRNLTPQTPGTEPVTPVEKLDETPSDTEEPETKPQAGDEVVTVKLSELEALIDAKVAEGVKAHRRATELGKQKKEDLPTQASIDTDKLERAVLTQDGWVCPKVDPADAKRMANGQKIMV